MSIMPWTVPAALSWQHIFHISAETAQKPLYVVCLSYVWRWNLTLIKTNSDWHLDCIYIYIYNIYNLQYYNFTRHHKSALISKVIVLLVLILEEMWDRLIESVTLHEQLIRVWVFVFQPCPVHPLASSSPSLPLCQIHRHGHEWMK